MNFLKLLQLELLRVLGNRKIILFLFLACLGNAVLLYVVFDRDEISYQHYREIKNICVEDTDEFVSMYFENMESPELKQLYEEYQTVSGYGEYLLKVQSEAKKNADISIFKNNFAKKNILKTASDYKKLETITPSVIGGYGLSCAVSFFGTKILILIMINILIMEVVLEDKRMGVLPMFRATRLGRYGLAWSKLLVVMTGTVFINIILKLSNVLIAVCCYGEIEFYEPIQSLYGYSSCGMKITILDFLVLDMLISSLLYICIAFALFAAASYTDNIAIYYCIGVMLCALAYGFYYIGERASIIWLEKTSPYFCINEEKLFAYYNYNMFGNPAPLIVVNIAFIIIATLIFAGTGLFLFVKYSYGYRTISLKTGLIRFKTSKNLLGMEFYRVLIGNRIWLVLMFLLVWQLSGYALKNVTWYQGEVFYRYYIKQIEGDFSREKMNYMEEERARLLEIYAQYNEYYEKFDNGEISEKTLEAKVYVLEPEIRKLEGFEQSYQYIKYIEGLENSGRGIVYDRGWNYLVGDVKYANDIKNGIILMLVLVIGLSGLFTEDYRYDLSALLETTYRYKKMVRCRKIIIFIYTTVSFLMVYLPEGIWVSLNYGLSGSMYTANSIEKLNHICPSVTLVGYFIIIYCIRFCTALLIAFLVAYMGKCVKKMNASIVIAFVIFVLPLVLSLFGLSIINGFSLNKFISGNMLFQ